MNVEHQGQKTKILVVGGGGHAKVVLDALRCNSYEIVGILEADVHLVGTDVCGIPVIGTDADAWRFFQEGVTHAVVAIGHLGNYSVRKKCIERLLEIGFELDTIIHKSAVVSPYAQLQQGTVVLAGAIINAGARVGAHCIINTGAIVEHDVVLGENVHVAPKAAISGVLRPVGSLSFLYICQNNGSTSTAAMLVRKAASACSLIILMILITR